MKPVLLTRDTKKVAASLVRALESEKKSRIRMGESYNDHARRRVLEDETD
jgi:hypothetical protein